MTIPCDQTRRVHAYHDGELDAADGAQVQAHLRQCPACAAELAWLTESRRAILNAPTPALPPALIESVHDRLAREPYRPALRLAWWLTAAAAAVIAVCVPRVQLVQSTQAAEAPPLWELAAASPGAATTDEQALARWMAQDLAGPVNQSNTTQEAPQP